jgi:hypothetical protein
MQSALEKHVYVTKPSGERVGIGEAVAGAQPEQKTFNRVHAR